MEMRIGDTIENFTLQNTEGTPVSLEELTNNGKAVLLFFPVAFSGVCTDEMCSARDNMKMFESLNARVAAISVDSFFALRQFKKVNNLNFALLSDFNKEVSKQFNSLYDDFYGMKGVSKRSAFVINEDMQLEYVEILDDADQVPDFMKITEVLGS